MSTHNIYSHGEIRKKYISTFGYLRLFFLNQISSFLLTTNLERPKLIAFNFNSL